MKKINEPNTPLWMKSNNDEIEFYNDPQEDSYVIKLYGSEYIGLHIGEVEELKEMCEAFIKSVSE